MFIVAAAERERQLLLHIGRRRHGLANGQLLVLLRLQNGVGGVAKEKEGADSVPGAGPIRSDAAALHDYNTDMNTGEATQGVGMLQGKLKTSVFTVSSDV